MSNPVLHLKNASIFQEENLVLSNISLEINKGDFIAHQELGIGHFSLQVGK